MTDRWQLFSYAMIVWRYPDGPLTAKCKYPVEGKRCNAKMAGDEAVQKLAAHLARMHNFRFDWGKRFSAKLDRERKQEDGK